MTMASLMGALLMGLVPSLKSCESEPVAFEKYEKEGEWFYMSVDVPQGDDERAANLKKGILTMVARTGVGGEVGQPIAGTLQQVTDDYCQRYEQYGEEYLHEQQTPLVPMGYVEIANVHQNELCATFKVGDGVFVNGGPSSYYEIVRFSDGKVMEQDELYQFTAEDLERLATKYNTDKDMPVSISTLEWGWWVLPLTEDSCMLTWEVSRYDFGEAKIPLAEVDRFLTDEGRQLLKAKPYKLEPRPDDAAMSEEEEEEYDESYDTNIGLNGSIPEGTSTYEGDMSNFPIELTITKDGDSYQALYRNIRYKATMNLNGESLPADGGDVNFYGKDAQGNAWTFHLTGDASTTITGTADGDNQQLNITLRRK